MTNYPKATVSVDKALMDLYSSELLECHRLLDTIGINQSGYEEQLSISQRVSDAVALVIRLRTAQPIIPWAKPQ